MALLPRNCFSFLTQFSQSTLSRNTLHGACVLCRRTIIHQLRRQSPHDKRPFVSSRLHLYPAAAAATASPSFAKKTTKRHETHYDFFPESLPGGPPPQGPFTIDVKKMRQEFLQIQAAAHPDRHQGGAKRRAEALSARINEAYKTLQDPLLRAQYILSLNGIDVAGDESAKLNGDGEGEDKELLMQVLEDREEIEDAQEEKDLRLVRERNDERMKESIRALENIFENGDWDAARREAQRLRYWVNIKDAVDNWERGKPVVLIH